MNPLKAMIIMDMAATPPATSWAAFGSTAPALTVFALYLDAMEWKRLKSTPKITPAVISMAQMAAIKKAQL